MSNESGMNSSSEARFLRIEGLSKSYPSPDGKVSEPVFDSVNFVIQKGEFVCIIGQ